MHCQKQLGWCIFNNAIILYFAIESVSHSCDCCLFLGRQPTNISPPAPWNLVVCCKYSPRLPYFVSLCQVFDELFLTILDPSQAKAQPTLETLYLKTGPSLMWSPNDCSGASSTMQVLTFVTVISFPCLQYLSRSNMCGTWLRTLLFESGRTPCALARKKSGCVQSFSIKVWFCFSSPDFGMSNVLIYF